jgi:hypothetical protein
MAMSTWGELQTAVLRTLDAEQDEWRQLMLPVWKDLAETDIYQSLRAGWMVRAAEAVTDGPLMTVPPSLIELQGIGVVNQTLTDEDLAEWEATGRILRLDSVAEQPLEAIGPEQVAAVGRYWTVPRYYLVTGHSIRLVPWQGPPLLTRFTYWSKGDDMTADLDFNEVLHHAPGCYLYGILRHEALARGDTQAEARWTQALLATVERANAAAYGWQGTGIVARRTA